MTTDANGIARFLHVRRFLPGEDEPHPSWRVRLDASFADEIARKLDGTQLPAEPVHLVLPATGSLRVRVLDAEGQPWLGEARVGYTVLRAGQTRTLAPLGDLKRVTRRAVVTGGEAVFERVGLGLDLAISASRARSSVSTTSFARGPVEAGEEATVAIAFGADNLVVRARILGVDGKPMRDRSVNVTVEERYEYPTGNAYGARFETDGAGRVYVDIWEPIAPSASMTVMFYLGESDAPDAYARPSTQRWRRC